MNPLEQIQDFVLGRLTADPAIANVVILEERKGVTSNDLAQTLSSMTLRGGKKGAAIVLEVPTFDVRSPNAPGPRLDLQMVIRCIEKPLVNRGPGGAGISAEEIAMRVTQILHHFIVYSLPITLVAQKGEGATYDGGERERAVLVAGMLQLPTIGKPNKPTFAGGSIGGVTISGPAGTTVYYTTDGSYPSASNPSAQIVNAELLGQGGGELLGQDADPLFSQNANRVVAAVSGTPLLAVAYPADPTQQASDLAFTTVS